MSEQNAEQPQEPSMEEILASIRRIISEDDVEQTASDDDQPPELDPEADLPPSEPEDEAPAAPELDTSEDVPEPEPEPDPPMMEAAPDPEPPPPPPPPPPKEDVLELTNVVQDRPPAEDPVIDLNRPPIAPRQIVSDQPAMSTSEYFARLAIIAQERGQLGGSITVEEMARELMRPMLQSWLDENLPRIVERLVQNEIERIVRKAHDL